MTPETRLKLEAALTRFYLDHLDAIGPDGGTVETSAVGATIKLSVSPPAAVKFTHCERQVLDIFGSVPAGTRLAAKEVASAMMRRMGERAWKRSTVQRSLANLVARGLLVNEYNGLGYTLADQPADQAGSEAARAPRLAAV